MDTASQAQVVQAALGVLDAYMQRFQPSWTSSLLYQVVRLTLEKLHNPALAEAEAQQLAERVIAAYRLQGTSGSFDEKADAVLWKNLDAVSLRDADAIAAQVGDEIAQFRAKQAAVLSQVDVSQPLMGDDLSLSSAMQETPIAEAARVKDESGSKSPEADRNHL